MLSALLQQPNRNNILVSATIHGFLESSNKLTLKPLQTKLKLNNKAQHDIASQAQHSAAQHEASHGALQHSTA